MLSTDTQYSKILVPSKSTLYILFTALEDSRVKRNNRYIVIIHKYCVHCYRPYILCILETLLPQLQVSKPPESCFPITCLIVLYPLLQDIPAFPLNCTHFLDYLACVLFSVWCTRTPQEWDVELAKGIQGDKISKQFSRECAFNISISWLLSKSQLAAFQYTLLQERESIEWNEMKEKRKRKAPSTQVYKSRTEYRNLHHAIILSSHSLP